jgi:hypothetical protein
LGFFFINDEPFNNLQYHPYEKIPLIILKKQQQQQQQNNTNQPTINKSRIIVSTQIL